MGCCVGAPAPDSLGSRRGAEALSCRSLPGQCGRPEDRVRLPPWIPAFPSRTCTPTPRKLSTRCAPPRAPRSPSFQEPRGLLWPREPPPSPSRMEAAAAGAGGEDKSRTKFVSRSRSPEGRDRAGPLGGDARRTPRVYSRPWRCFAFGASQLPGRAPEAMERRRLSSGRAAGDGQGVAPGRTRRLAGCSRPGAHFGVCGRELDPHGAPKLPCDRTSVPDTLGRPGPGLRVRPQRPAPREGRGAGTRAGKPRGRGTPAACTPPGSRDPAPLAWGAL